MSKTKLEGCVISSEKERLRDEYLKELYANNRVMNSVYNKSMDMFWKLFEKYVKKNLSKIDNSGYDTNLEDIESSGFYDLVEKKTSFTRRFGYPTYLYYLPDLEKRFDSHPVGDLAIHMLGEFSFKEETGAKLEELMKRNSELLANLCKIDLEARLGQYFKGIYPYSGLDINTPTSIGGEWLLIEPDYKEPDFEERLKEQSSLGKKALEEGRIKLTHSPILEQKILAKDIKSFTPDVVLIKLPTPGAEYEDLVSFYEKFVSKDTLIIADKELESPNMIPVKNLAGIKGLELLESEKPILSWGCLSYPLTSFRMYTLKSKEHVLQEKKEMNKIIGEFLKANEKNLEKRKKR